VQADIIVWDFETRQLRNRFTLHKGKIQAVAFSPNDKYIASVGGQDDNSVIVWDLEQNIAVCGSPASQDSAGVALSLTFLNNSDEHFITGGYSTLRVWEINSIQRKVKPVDCQLGQIKRVITCIYVDQQDENMFCGTTTGDILRINIQTKLFKHSGPPKDKVIAYKDCCSR
jgi:WD40 repeat protein